jgi:hypothetical protein
MTDWYPSRVIVPVPEPGVTHVEEAEQIKADLERMFPDYVFGVFLEALRPDNSIAYTCEAAPRKRLQ